MRRRIVSLLAGICVAVLLIVYLNNPKETHISQSVTINSSSIPEGEEEREDPLSENPIDRTEFEYKQLVNPKTGEVPFKIKEREKEYADKFLRPSDGGQDGESLFKFLRSSASTTTSGAEFESVGPYNIGGRTRAVVIDVDNENTIIAGGVSGGIWKTEDQGTTWSRKSSLQDHPAVTSIVQDVRAGHHNEWYYSTGEFRGNSASASGAFFRGNGVYKSADNGETWELIASTAQPGTSGTDVLIRNSEFTIIDQLAIDYSEESGTEIYASGLSKVIRSTDGFETWEVVLGESNGGINLTDIAITSQGKLFAAIGSSSFNGSSAEDGLFMSTDGVTWESLDPGPNFPSTFNRFEIAIDPSDETKVYFVGSNNLFLFNDISDSWTDLSDNLGVSDDDVGEGHSTQGGYNLYAAVHPSNSNVLFIGGTNLLRSSDKFATTNTRMQIGGYGNDNNPNSFPRYLNHHPDNHDYAFFPSNPNKMISATDGGVHLTLNNLATQSTDNPVSWRSLNNGYITTQFYHVSINESNLSDQLILGGMQDNGSWAKTTTNAKETWTEVFGGDGAFSAVTHNSLYVSSQRGNMLRLELIGNTYEFAGNISPSDNQGDFLFINPFIVNPVNQEQMFVASNAKVFFTNDLRLNPGNGQWGEISSRFLSLQPISALAMSIQPEGVLYLGTQNGRVFKVNDTRDLIDGQVDEQISDVNMPTGNISSIAVDPRDADRILVCYSNYEVLSLWLSENGGDTWTPVAGNLEENPDGSGAGPSTRSVAIMPDGQGGNYYFVGTSVGLFMTQSLDGENTVWEQQAVNSIGNVVVSQVVVRPIEGLVVASTHGNGVFKATYDVGVTPRINYSKNSASQSYTLRGNVSFNSAIPLSYQWLKNGVEVEGANSAELEVFDGGDYQLRVSKSTEISGLSNIVSVNLDGVGPEVVSIERLSPATQNTDATTVRFKVTFNEDVVDISSDDFLVEGDANGIVGSVAIITDATVFDVSVMNIGGEGTLSLGFRDSNNITDLVGNAFTGEVGSSESYTIEDTTRPTATFKRSAPITRITDQNRVSFLVEFSEDVRNVDVTDFQLENPIEKAEISSVEAVVNNSSYVVEVAQIIEDGEINLNFSASQDIADASGNTFDGLVLSEETYTINNVIAGLEAGSSKIANIQVDANPSAGQFSLTLPVEFTGRVEYNVVNASGISVAIGEVANYQSGDKLSIDIRGQADGLYIFEAAGNKGKETVKLLKRTR